VSRLILARSRLMSELPSERGLQNC